MKQVKAKTDPKSISRPTRPMPRGVGVGSGSATITTMARKPSPPKICWSPAQATESTPTGRRLSHTEPAPQQIAARTTAATPARSPLQTLPPHGQGQHPESRETRRPASRRDEQTAAVGR